MEINVTLLLVKKAMNTIGNASQLVLCLCCLFAATLASFRLQLLDRFAPLFPMSGAGRSIQAALFWLALVVTILGITTPFVAFFGACLAFFLAIPLALQAARKRLLGAWPLPFVIAIASVVVAMVRPLGLKVIALPKADNLPFEPVRSRVVKTFDEGFWLEGIAAGKDGTLFLSGNRGLDFSKSDYYRDARGELVAVNPDGSGYILLKMPMGLASGVPVVAPDSSIYLTSHGDTSYIWHIATSGHASKLAKFPNGAWPNGLDWGPDGMLYSPDSFLGVVWRVNPTNGKVEVALRQPALLPRPFLALAPGANGLHFKGRDLIVTVSDRTTILRYVMDDHGHLGPATTLASGIPGDDFAIGHDGSLFVTTHPYNTLVRVSPHGERTIIAKQEQHIVGATDAAFGRTAQDHNVLYVVTDGGAFNGGPKTRGELVALYPYGNQ